MQRSQSELDLVFGRESSGNSPEQRAKTSRVQFVKSQVQLARATASAKGRRLSALEALNTFGFDALLEVAREKSSTLVSSRDEPAKAIKSRRWITKI